MSNSWPLSDLISLNAGGVGRQLPLKLPIGLLLDTDRCRLMQRLIADAASDGAWEVLPAASTSQASVPDLPGVYMFVWCPPLTLTRSSPHSNQQLRYVLYVGKAGGPEYKNTLRQRFKTYIKYFSSNPELLFSNDPLPSREARMRCYLSLEPLEYWFLACESTDTIRDIEARLQALLNPPINKRRERILRAGPSQKAF